MDVVKCHLSPGQLGQERLLLQSHGQINCCQWSAFMQEIQIRNRICLSSLMYNRCFCQQNAWKSTDGQTADLAKARMLLEQFSKIWAKTAWTATGDEETMSQLFSVPTIPMHLTPCVQPGPSLDKSILLAHISTAALRALFSTNLLCWNCVSMSVTLFHSKALFPQHSTCIMCFVAWFSAKAQDKHKYPLCLPTAG